MIYCNLHCIDTLAVLHVNVGLAQARPNYVIIIVHCAGRHAFHFTLHEGISSPRT